MPARTRSRSTRVFGALAAAMAATAVLSACGSDDSTATSTPTTTTSVTTSTSTVSATDEADPTTAGETTGDSTPGDEQSAPPAAGEPAPGGGAAAPSAEGDEFLAALRAEGVEPSDEAAALSIADYICSAQSQGGTPSEVKTFVTALVGSESVTSGGEITEEQAAATADTYIAVAGDTYCS